MGDGFQFIDIILFAMIAAFLILRLRNVLGRRDGHEGGYRDAFKPGEEEETQAADGGDNVVQLPDRNADEAFEHEAEVIAAMAGGDATLAAGITDIRAVDPTFNTEDFLVGGRVAFEMVLGAYATGDRETLENLLSPDVLRNFIRAIDEREEAGQTMEDTLVGIRKADIVEAYMDSSVAMVTVKFLSEQVNVVRDAEGQIASGNPNEVTDVIDFWTFARDTQMSDPNWLLVATRSLD
ncbi:MAG: Tim44 domain-containing protein [Rhodospirillaceae bacterium]|nr:Tim44 domain-containing protein [Rhodospirillaceae bacterium]